MDSSKTVLLTDRAWPDANIERELVEKEGYELVDVQAEAGSTCLESLIRIHRPAAIMTCWATIADADIAAAEGLKIIARMGIGVDNIAVDEATKRGVWVSNVPDYCVEEVSDHAMALMLSWTRQLVRLNSEVKAGVWNSSATRLLRLQSLTVGLIGHGRIGRRIAVKLAPFGCKILTSVRGSRTSTGGPAVLLDTLLMQSDIIVIVAPLTDETRGLINSERLGLMRPDALLINVSRGPIVDSQALMTALENAQLGGAALDVIDGEPEVPDALRLNPRVTLTPHVAFASDTSISVLRRQACENVTRVLQGLCPLNPCNRLDLS